MTDLSSKLKRLAEFDEPALHRMLTRALEVRSGFTFEQEDGMKMGAQWQHARLTPLLTALLECAEALEWSQDRDLDWDMMSYRSSLEKLQQWRAKCSVALSRLQALVEDEK